MAASRAPGRSEARTRAVARTASDCGRNRRGPERATDRARSFAGPNGTCNNVAVPANSCGSDLHCSCGSICPSEICCFPSGATPYSFPRESGRAARGLETGQPPVECVRIHRGSPRTRAIFTRWPGAATVSSRPSLSDWMRPAISSHVIALASTDGKSPRRERGRTRASYRGTRAKSIITFNRSISLWRGSAAKGCE
jgi:hypothetical protein